MFTFIEAVFISIYPTETDHFPVRKGFQYTCMDRLHFNCTFISNHNNKITFPAHSDWFFQSQTLKTIY